jgi:PhnB protein
MLMRFKDTPKRRNLGRGPADSNKVIHAQIRIGQGAILASDGHPSGNPKFEGFALSLSLPTEGEPTRQLMRWPMAAKWRCRWPSHLSRRGLA